MINVFKKSPTLLISSIHFIRLIGVDCSKMLQVHKERAEILPDHSLCVRLIPACERCLVVDPELHHAVILGDICATKTNIHTDKPFWMCGKDLLFYVFKGKCRRKALPFKLLNLSNEQFICF